jgi:hypothetical protein
VTTVFSILAAESLAKLNLGFTFQDISAARNLGQLDIYALLNLKRERNILKQPSVKSAAAQLLRRSKSEITRNL